MPFLCSLHRSTTLPAPLLGAPYLGVTYAGLTLADRSQRSDAPFSVPLGVALLALACLLLLAALAGGLIAVRVCAARWQSSARMSRIVHALPFPAALAGPDGKPIAANAEAAHWIEHLSGPHLAPPLARLAGQVAASRRPETARVVLGENQPSIEMQASPWPTPGGDQVLLMALPAQLAATPHLTSLIAHELRTPLAAIVGHAEILASCAPSDTALWQRSCQFIAGETQRLAGLVNDWLSLSRLESAPLLRTTNLRAVIESASSVLYERAETKGLSLLIESPNSLPRVRADGQRLEQAVYNLLDNAIKYTPSGGTITVRLLAQQDRVQVEVADNGLGIPAEDLPHIFEPLYRSEGVRALPGTGLGLTLVHAILNQQGARIQVHSQPGQGAAFTFRLPIAR